jgi:chromosomal replication initiation ATPase DnaA
MNIDFLWNKFLERIKNEVNSMVYKTYFSNTKLITKEDNKLIISVPNIICQKRLDSSYSDIINGILLELTSETYELKFILEEEVSKIIECGSLLEQQRLSRNYFNKDGFYRQIILHYATLLKYVGILIPNPTPGKKLSTSHISKKYF